MHRSHRTKGNLNRLKAMRRMAAEHDTWPVSHQKPTCHVCQAIRRRLLVIAAERLGPGFERLPKARRIDLATKIHRDVTTDYLAWTLRQGRG